MCDRTLVLTGFYSRQDFDTPRRRIRFKDPLAGKRLVFLTNNFALPAITITEQYRCRWQVELFSNGSSNIFVSKSSSAHPRTPSKPKS